jgi:antitoxin CcdA
MNPSTPQRAASSGRRPLNLSHDEGIVAEARSYTSNLSATIENLLTDYINTQQRAQRVRIDLADACSKEWNAVSAAHGSFADEHTTL